MGAAGFERAADPHEPRGEAATKRETGRVETPNNDRWRGRDPDDALRDAIHAAVEAGQYERARALLDILATASLPAAVVHLRERTTR